MFGVLPKVALIAGPSLSMPFVFRLSISSLFFILFSTSSAKAAITLRVEQVGPNPFAGGAVDLFDGILTGPHLISSDSSLVEEPDPSASIGSLFGLQADLYRLVVPQGYLSNSPLAGVSTYRNVNISGLGLSLGLATWTWGSASNVTFDSINLEVVPGPLPLAGAATTFGWCRKLRRRALRSQSM
jgi:hypothetical protein